MNTGLSTTVEAELRDRLIDVCHQVDIPADSGTLIKYTMNAVFRVGDYVVRLAHGDHARTLAQRTTILADELARLDIPIIRLAADLSTTPIHAGNWTATIWQYVPTNHVDPWPVDLAIPLRALHAVDRLHTTLPPWDIFAKVRRRIAHTACLVPTAAAELDRWARAEIAMPAARLLQHLSDWCDDLHQQMPTIRWHLPPGPLHGDAHTGNLLLRGTPERPAADPTTLLCDLDGLCKGPREWDLVPTAHGTTRFGRSRTAYDAFAEDYGFDILTWSGWPVLVRLRELQLVTSVIDSLTGRPAVADELALRLRSLLADDANAVWTRYR